MTEVDIDDKASHKDLPANVKHAIDEKLRFRAELAQKVYITRLDYIFRVLKQMMGRKANIADPDAFKDKIKMLRKAEKKKDLLQR